MGVAAAMHCVYVAQEEANTSLEMLMFSGENADCQRNLQRFYRESKNG